MRYFKYFLLFWVSGYLCACALSEPTVHARRLPSGAVIKLFMLHESLLKHTQKFQGYQLLLESETTGASAFDAIRVRFAWYNPGLRMYEPRSDLTVTSSQFDRHKQITYGLLAENIIRLKEQNPETLEIEGVFYPDRRGQWRAEMVVMRAGNRNRLTDNFRVR